MRLDQAVIMLEELGSDHDPVCFNGQETTPRELGEALDGHEDASRIRIDYFGFYGAVSNGTMTGMIRDRQRGSKPPRLGGTRPPRSRCKGKHSWIPVGKDLDGANLLWCSMCGCLRSGAKYRHRRAP